jgi:hypothetical protein
MGAAPSTSFRSGGQGPYNFLPLRVFCRTVVVFLSRSSLFLSDLIYIDATLSTGIFGAENVMGMWRSTIFKVCKCVNICITTTAKDNMQTDNGQLAPTKRKIESA